MLTVPTVAAGRGRDQGKPALPHPSLYLPARLPGCCLTVASGPERYQERLSAPPALHRLGIWAAATGSSGEPATRSGNAHVHLWLNQSHVLDRCPGRATSGIGTGLTGFHSSEECAPSWSGDMDGLSGPPIARDRHRNCAAGGVRRSKQPPVSRRTLVSNWIPKTVHRC